MIQFIDSIGITCKLYPPDGDRVRLVAINEQFPVTHTPTDPVEWAEDWRWSSAAAHCAACDSGGDMTEMQSEAEHLGSCPQTAAECDWLVDRAAGMTSSWSEHLAWRDDTELSQLMRRLENTGRPLGDTDFLKEIGQWLSRDFMPQKRGPKGPWQKKKPIT